jgi:tetrapyrrole methylase family protein/MazG family protein
MSIGERFESLVGIMANLRQPDGCPWDAEQTHQSLRQYLLEETYEVLECLDENDLEELPKELGDLLLQVVFHAQIGAENRHFDISEVISHITKKLIDRHPHVFGDAQISSAKEQEINWEKLKKKEGKKSVISDIPQHLPALQKALRLQQKAATVGFDWPDINGVWKKVGEEFDEFNAAIESGDQNHIEEEYGDLLFALVNLGRFIDCNPEDALRGTIAKFISRFQYIEQHFEKRGRELNDVSLAEMDAVWEQTKQKK